MMVMLQSTTSILIFLLIHHVAGEVCDILGGRTELILDVTESIGQEYNQTVDPDPLPIEGDPTTQIELILSDKGLKRFILNGKSLELIQPLDRDADDQSTLLFEITCKSRTSAQRKNIPVVVRIHDLNDNPPEFLGAPYEVTLREDTSVKTPIFKGIRADDKDSSRNGQVEYHILEINPGNNPGLFSIRFPHQGVVFLESNLDYEQSPVYYLTIEATDLATPEEKRLNSTTTLTIRVEDIDDQDPVFDTASIPPSCPSDPSTCVPQYHSSITEGEISGVIDIYPGRIHARDLDSLGATIIYSFLDGSPRHFNQYFEIDSRTAVITQKREVDRSQIKRFEILVQAMERTARKGVSSAKIVIEVEDVDTSPPTVVIPSFSGIVPEASKPGTLVIRDDRSGLPFVFAVTDLDISDGETPPDYIFELTTSAFAVNEKGELVVAVPNLDRDPPSLADHTFQVIAREDKKNGAASSPVTITVRLLDINDNPPRLSVLPTVRVSAGSSRKKVLRLQATDADEGVNSIVRYELTSGNQDHFSIDPTLGDLYAFGEMVAGEEYLLDIKVTDTGNLSTEGFVKVVVSRGPNTSGPLFSRSEYSAMIPEDIAHGGHVTSVKASDPDGDSTYFSITEGNELKSFEIDTLSGLIIVVAPLDREKKDNYNLVITAEDSERKSNTANVFIKVTDVNDEVPQFIGVPFSFRVDEGLSDAPVGVVKAEDKDLGKSGEIAYTLEGETDLFRINALTGEIFTKTSLDYENEQVHYISIIARDMANDPQSSTTTVTILVNDVSDEAPYFPEQLYSVKIPEDVAIGSLIITVEAVDPDTKPSITYELQEGDSSLFKVAPDTGRITIAGQLDYETQPTFNLVVGTLEGQEKLPKSRTTVTIMVEDKNDEDPTLLPLHTTTFPKTAPVKTLLVNVSAEDKDGSSPNNQVFFNFSEDGDASEFFSISKDKGEIRLKKSLVDTNITEFMIKVTATDQGIPSRSTYGEFRVLLLEEIESGINVANSFSLNAQTESLASSPRFPKETFKINVNENMKVGSIIVKVPMVNTTSSIACSIIEGNEKGMFTTRISNDGSCKIVTLADLDFEIDPGYNLTLALHPVGTDVKEDTSLILSEAFVYISIIDMNDNSPTFLLEDFEILKNYPENTILSYALQSYPVDTKVIELKALDFDSGKQGLVEYKLLPETNRGNYFSIDSKTGRLYTKRKLENVPLELRPFNLSLIAKDKPGMNGTQHSSSINVIIPVVEEIHRSVLVLDSPKNVVDQKVHFLRRVLSESTGKAAQVEMVKQVRKKKESGMKITSQVWFHLLEPNTWLPISSETLMDDKVKSKLLEDVSMSLEGIKALQLASPAEVNQKPLTELKKSLPVLESEDRSSGIMRFNLAESLGAIEYVLLVLALIIILFVACAIILICVLWSKYAKKWNKADKTVMLFQPPLEPAGSVIDAVSKEYEVQVLHMCVPLDDESVQEAQVEADSTRQYCLDNVSYISKSQNGIEESTSNNSSGPTTPRTFGRNEGLSRWSPDTPAVGNYDPYSGNVDDSQFSASTSNENVMFGRRGFPDPSPVETTTEL